MATTTSMGVTTQLTAVRTHDSDSDSNEDEPTTDEVSSLRHLDEIPLSASTKRLKTQHPSVLQQGFKAYLKNSLRVLTVGEPGDRPWLNVLILLVPIAFAADGFQWTNGITFALALLAICPFAERLNFVTEDLTKYTNATIGGLLNASFGNVTEMIVSIMALRQGELWIIQASMLGSILSNLLLVLGSAFFVGGCRQHRGTGSEGVLQSYNTHAANVNISLLLLCVAAFSLPGILVSDIAVATDDGDALSDVSSATGNSTAGAAGQVYSVCAAIFLLLVYGLYLLFQLRTHSGMFNDEDGEDDDNEDEDDAPVLGFWGAMFWLGIATIFISLLSNILVDSFTRATDGIGVPDAFAWTILVPIVGNAAEHASAVIFAYVLSYSAHAV